MYENIITLWLKKWLKGEKTNFPFKLSTVSLFFRQNKDIFKLSDPREQSENEE